MSASIQDDNSYVNPPSPSQDFASDPSGGMLNGSDMGDNSYMAPSSPTAASFDDSNDMPDDMSAIC